MYTLALSVELARQKKHDHCESLLLQLCALSTDRYGIENVLTRRCLLRLGVMYTERGRWEDGAITLGKVVTPDVNIAGFAHVEDELTAFACQSLSMLYHFRGNGEISRYWADRERLLVTQICTAEDEYLVNSRKRWYARANGQPARQWFTWLDF